jgi:hypothetical protein
MHLPMKRNIACFFIMLFGLQASLAQEGSRKPDLPGTFVLDFGFNRPRNTPDDFQLGFWGSRTVNVYYQYEFALPVLKKHFSVLPAVGLGMDRYKFSNNYTMAYESGELVLTDADLEITKSHLVTNYLDVPLEIRYTKNPDDPARSFKIGAGARFGYLVSGFTKYKYEDEDGGSMKDKRKGDWNLNQFRYGVFGRIGFGNFSVFANYSLSPLFNTDEGPDQSSINNVTFGISLSSF